MRKIAAILLLLLLAFNWYGYRIVISMMQNDADRRLESKIDKNEYNESQLIEIRVKLDMPYQHRYTNFERYYGEIEIEGKSYTYVKRKVEGDVLILQCLPNRSRQELKAIDNDLALMNNGPATDQTSKQQQNSFAKNFWSEYDGQDGLQSSENLISQNTTLYSYYQFRLPSVAVNTPHQPPEC